MNKNGKSNIIFIILIPVFFILSLIIIDTITSYNTNKTYKLVTEDIIKKVMENEKLDYNEYYKEIKRLYELRGYETDMLTVSANEYKVTVDNEHQYFGIISSITNPNGETSKVNILGAEFDVKKGSKATISIEARYDNYNEIIFEYVE